MRFGVCDFVIKIGNLVRFVGCYGCCGVRWGVCEGFGRFGSRERGCIKSESMDWGDIKYKNIWIWWVRW